MMSRGRGGGSFTVVMASASVRGGGSFTVVMSRGRGGGSFTVVMSRGRGREFHCCDVPRQGEGVSLL